MSDQKIESPFIRQDKFLQILESTHCSKCDYEEAEGELFQHCHDCCVKIINKIHAHFDSNPAKKGKK